jgi:hypothetical protein
MNSETGELRATVVHDLVHTTANPLKKDGGSQWGSFSPQGFISANLHKPHSAPRAKTSVTRVSGTPRTWAEWVDKVCPTCNSQFRVKAKYVRRGEGKFCSVRCGVINSNHARGPAATKAALNAIARRLWIERHGGLRPSCTQCGFSPADIHHEDGNRFNNSPENLIPLCRSHHVALENHRFPKRKRTGATR